MRWFEAPEIFFIIMVVRRIGSDIVIQLRCVVMVMIENLVLQVLHHSVGMLLPLSVLKVYWIIQRYRLSLTCQTNQEQAITRKLHFCLN